MINIAEQKSVYDDIYSNINNYNYYDEVKNEYVDSFAELICGKILDAGCGEGIHLKRLLSKGYDVFGIELSEVCCKKYLQDTPHKNIDILSYGNTNDKYDGLICMDVLEHIDPLHLDDTISALNRLAPAAFFGIANHSDIINGIELHLIKQDSEWWMGQLTKHYKYCCVIAELSYGADSPIFFMIYCDNGENDRLSHALMRHDKGKFIGSLISYFGDANQRAINKIYNNLTACTGEIAELQKKLETSRRELCDTRQELDATRQTLERLLSHPVVKPQLAVYRFFKQFLNK